MRLYFLSGLIIFGPSEAVPSSMGLSFSSLSTSHALAYPHSSLPSLSSSPHSSLPSLSSEPVPEKARNESEGIRYVISYVMKTKGYIISSKWHDLLVRLSDWEFYLQTCFLNRISSEWTLKRKWTRLYECPRNCDYGIYLWFYFFLNIIWIAFIPLGNRPYSERWHKVKAKANRRGSECSTSWSNKNSKAVQGNGLKFPQEFEKVAEGTCWKVRKYN